MSEQTNWQYIRDGNSKEHLVNLNHVIRFESTTVIGGMQGAGGATIMMVMADGKMIKIDRQTFDDLKTRLPKLMAGAKERATDENSPIR